MTLSHAIILLGDKMRLRKVKGATALLAANDSVINEPESLKGQWHQVFQNKNLIHIEIGMGKGDFIIKMALANPQINYIGIEKYDSVLVRAIEKVSIPIHNLRFIRCDANNIEKIFDHEVDIIYLNHSDPWPKERHAKRRLTSAIFLSKYKLISRLNTNIIMQTDNALLFEFSIKSLHDELFDIKEINYDYRPHNKIMTEYESKFRSLNQPIYYLKAVYYRN